MGPDAGPGRLTSALLIGVLARRVAAAGGFATVVMRGDATSGVILVQLVEKGQEIGLFERMAGLDGRYRLDRCGPAPDEGPEALSQYIARRRRSDPDLWVIELDIPDGERFAAETIC
ncbi:DUF1491 family protein [Sphingobium sp. AN558]|uniref:DUF1491 family protein n=1 Tax=Sphingobium sp. AN558 TaxID=3133442 RepID=UPI0030C42F63